MSQGIGVSPDDSSEAEEDLFDYVVEQVAGSEPADDVSRRNRSGEDRYHDRSIGGFIRSGFFSRKRYTVTDDLGGSFLSSFRVGASLGSNTSASC